MKTWGKNWCCPHKPGCGDSQLSHLGFAGHEPKSSLWRWFMVLPPCCPLTGICVWPTRVAPWVSDLRTWSPNQPHWLLQVYSSSWAPKKPTPQKELKPKNKCICQIKVIATKKLVLRSQWAAWRGGHARKMPLTVFLRKVPVRPSQWCNASVWSADTR